MNTEPTPSSHRTRLLVIGAGPAGLTAAHEGSRLGHEITVLEKDPLYVGGISRTIEAGGYRFDLGGHRFFSKSPEITRWWKERLPHDFISVRRMSRIFYRGTFFDYPLKTGNALFGLGIFTSLICGLSYLKARVFPIRPEKSFADWVSNRFGKKLFNIFFKTYTEKVWGMPCDQISADWAAQRIKGLSLASALKNAVLPAPRTGAIKTLIDKFEYPRLGPGMMWEKTRDDIVAAGGRVLNHHKAVAIHHDGARVCSVQAIGPDGTLTHFSADHFIFSLPLREAVEALMPPPPLNVLKAARSLRYRDFLTVALVVEGENPFPDNWIYIHDPTVKLGRIQNFRNWSEALVPESGRTCLGLEYFCFEGDQLWNLPDADLIALGTREVAQIGLVRPEQVKGGHVLRVEKAYPVYYPDYANDVSIIRDFLQQLKNAQPVGRNGMHKYNNQDHSMMTGLLAARNLSQPQYDLWKVNGDAEYHEETRTDDETGRATPHSLPSGNRSPQKPSQGEFRQSDLQMRTPQTVEPMSGS